MGEEAGGGPQQERSRRTRAALLDAAIECLAELGYAETTVTEVAKRAGVSRGAQLHHFPTKAELLTAAVTHLFDRRMALYRKAFANLDPGADRLDASIELLWSMYGGPGFIAWAELWMAARSDETLRAAVVEMDRNFLEQSWLIYAEMFPEATAQDAEFQRLTLDFAFALMDGAALRSLVPHDHHRPPPEN